MLNQQFVEDIIMHNMPKGMAFEKHFPEKCVDKTEEEIEALAEKKLKEKENAEFYALRAKGIEEQEESKRIWTTELFNKKAIEYAELLEKKIFKEGNEKMAVNVNYINILKELNLVNGLQERKVTMNVNPIQITFGQGLAQIDDKGNIIDGECKEIPNENTEIEEKND